MDTPSHDPALAVQFQSSPGQPWQEDPCFRRYWQHYHDVRQWYYTHWFPGLSMMQHNYRYMPQFCQASPFMAMDPSSTSYYEMNHDPYMGPWGSSMQHQPYWQSGYGSQMAHNPHRNYATVTQNLTRDEQENDSEDDDDDESDDSFQMEMEVSQEMKEFFAKSEKHREERKKEIEDLKQRIFSGKEQDYINAEDLYKASVATSCKAPTEKPGQKRRHEMKILYGKDAAMIHGMETALQLQFDRNYDKRNPKLWPTIPIKL